MNSAQAGHFRCSGECSGANGRAAATIPITSDVAISESQKNVNQSRFLVTADRATKTAASRLIVSNETAEGNHSWTILRGSACPFSEIAVA